MIAGQTMSLQSKGCCGSSQVASLLFLLLKLPLSLLIRVVPFHLSRSSLPISPAHQSCPQYCLPPLGLHQPIQEHPSVFANYRIIHHACRVATCVYRAPCRRDCLRCCMFSPRAKQNRSKYSQHPLRSSQVSSATTSRPLTTSTPGRRPAGFILKWSPDYPYFSA